MRRPRCFFDISINGIASGRIVFELFTDVCPKTCENFRCLCTGEMGEGATTMKPLHYKNSPIHRIVRGFIVQGGDFSEGTGTGGESIYGGTFDDENFDLKHEHKFLLSMANKGPNTNGSQFFITTRPAPHLDGVHVVFGKVVSGQEFVLEIENQKVDGNHRPYADIRVSSCGELVAVIKKKKAKAELSKSESVTESEASSSQTGSSTEESESESGSESDGKASKRKRKKKVKVRKTSKKRQHGSKKVARSKKKKERAKHKKRKKQPQTPSESDSGPDEETMEPQLDPGVEVPPDIAEASKTSWLYRSSKSPPGRGKSPPAAKRSLHREREAESSEGRKRSPSPLQPRIRVSSSGRQIRGRGTVRYRTPPPSDSYLAEERSRSLHLPPHHFRDSRRKGWDDRSARDLHMRERGERGETGRRQRWRSRSPRRREVELRQRHFVSNSRSRSRSPRGYVRPLQRQRRRSDFRSRSGSRSRSQSPRARRSPLNHRQQRKSRSRSRNGNRFRSRSPGVRRRPIQRQQGRSRFRSHSRSGSRSRSRSKTPVDHTRHTIQRRQRRFQSSHSRSRSQSPGHTRPTVQRQHKRSRFDSRSGSTTSESSTGDRSPARLVQSRTRRSSSGSR